jgi:hypothetical protein
MAQARMLLLLTVLLTLAGCAEPYDGFESRFFELELHAAAPAQVSGSATTRSYAEALLNDRYYDPQLSQVLGGGGDTQLDPLASSSSSIGNTNHVWGTGPLAIDGDTVTIQHTLEVDDLPGYTPGDSAVLTLTFSQAEAQALLDDMSQLPFANGTTRESATGLDTSGTVSGTRGGTEFEHSFTQALRVLRWDATAL